ncbi:hypothetical protein HN588_00800 [Candidatus Bathyarchaeota archaeon]|nr:hypothetical protein [Candidatus Bathyarchaeota archaeon]
MAATFWSKLFSENAFLKASSYLFLLVGLTFLLSGFSEVFLGLKMFGHGECALIFSGVLIASAVLIELHRVSRLPQEEQDKLNSRKTCLPIDECWW